LAVSADVPPQDGEADAQREERKSPTPTGLLVGNKNSLQLLHPQVNMQLMLGKATTTSGNKRPQLQQITSTMKVVQAACVLETS
jgi:hypothetical protein